MRYVGINNLKPGDFLYNNVYDTNNRLLVTKDKPLDQNIINKLKELGYTGFYIKDDRYQVFNFSENIPYSLKNKATTDLKKMDIQATVENAKDIVKNILIKKNIYIDYIDTRNPENELFQHSVFVAEVSVVIGKALGLAEPHLIELATAALLHDVGKLCKNPKIMSKIMPANAKEIEPYVDEKHPAYGYRLLEVDKDYNLNPKIKTAILLHNKNEDGSGITGLDWVDVKPINNIPLYAKIIHVADEYDIKRNDPIMGSPLEAVEYLNGGYGTLFDQSVVNAFLIHVAVYPTGMPVMIIQDSKEFYGVVYQQNNKLPARPKVQLTNGEVIDLSTKDYTTAQIKTEQELIREANRNNQQENIRR